jgi:hypothetical protein
MISQAILLRSGKHFGRHVPAQAFGRVLHAIPEAVRQSVRMRFEGRSRARGKRPSWLKAAADVRFLGHEGDDETILHFETPSLGEAAPRLYSQQEIWPTRPDPADTGFDLLADVLVDVANQNADSERYDRPLLDSIAGFKAVLSGTFSELAVPSHRQQVKQAAVLTPAVADVARSLYTNTPLPQRVRVVGKLDMLRASTRSFGVILDDGQEIRGVLTEGEFESISRLMNQRVLVLGKAVYRPSGRLLRVDAEDVAATTEDNGSFFSAIPRPVRKTFSLRDTVRDQQHKLGVAAIIGKWPGDETDEQIAEALKGLN